MKTLIRFITIFSLAGICSFSFAGSTVIANSGTGLTAIDGAQLKKAFLGKMSKWPNGVLISACLEEADDASMTGFYKERLGKSASAYQAYWNRLLYSGKAVPPKTFESASGVIEYVAKTKGAICFLASDSDPLPKNVIVLAE